MIINIDQDNFTASPTLIEFIEKKVNKLTRFYDRIVQADVIIKKETASIRENKIAEIRLNVPNDTLFAKSESENIEAAINDVVSSLERQIKKYKDKIKTHPQQY